MASSLRKGKGREEPQGMDPEGLNPVITYRHLLSSGLGVRNPLRVIGLCDMDAFYAACEQARLGIDPSEPLVVRQWDSLIAVNYPARTYGISRMDKVSSALQRCPNLHVIHVATYDPAAPDAKPTYTDNPSSETHKVSLDLYRKESKKIIEIFKEVLPDAEVEKASIDEAFIDLTDPIRQHILACFPHLSEAPPEGLDSPLPSPPREGVPLAYPPSRATGEDNNGNIWTDLGTLVPVSGSSVPQPTKDQSSSDSPRKLTDQQFPYDENGQLNKGEGPSGPRLHTFDSLLTPEAEEVANKAPNDEDSASTVPADAPSYEELPPTWHDISLSIGASLMLKMRDEVKKRLVYTTSAGIARNKFLAKLVASYRKRDNQTILRNAAIPNYLRALPFQKIRFLGGKLGTAIAEAYDAQTVGDLLSISVEDMQRKFGENSIWVWEVLRGIDRSEVKEKPPVTKSMGASKNLLHPVTHPSEGSHWLRILAGELAFRLVEAREENPGLWPKTLVLSIRRSYQTSQSRQGSFPFTRHATIDYICKAAEKLWTELVGTGAEYDRNKAKGKVSGMKITNIFLGFAGVEAMVAGQRNIEGFFSTGGKRKAEASHDAIEDGGGKRKKSGTDHGDQDMDAMDIGDTLGTAVSFQCTRCGKQLRQTIDHATDRGEALRVFQMEHDDFHFALDLAKEGNEGVGDGIEDRGSMFKSKVKWKAEPKGIAKFFAPTHQKK